MYPVENLFLDQRLVKINHLQLPDPTQPLSKKHGLTSGKVIKRLRIWDKYLRNIEGEISNPTHIWPSSSKISPLNPDPQPMSSKRHVSFSGKFKSSRARND